MSEFVQETSGLWAAEDRSRSSSSSSERVQLPSVRALASRFNSLAQTEGIVVRGSARPGVSTSAARMSTPATAGSVKAATPPTKATAPSSKAPAPSTKVTAAATKPTAASTKIIESQIQKSAAASTHTAPQAPKSPASNDPPRASVASETDDEVFEVKTKATNTHAPTHFVKKQSKGEPKQKMGFSTLPSKSPAKKWNSLSDLHIDSSTKQRSDSVSSTTIFGVSLRRLDSISWGVTQARRSTVDDSDSSSDDESRISHQEADKVNSGSKLNTYQKNHSTEDETNKKRAGGGVKSKITQKMGNKEEVKYHSYSDLSTAGVEGGLMWPRTIAAADRRGSSHQLLTRRQSISDLLKLYRSKSQTDLSQAGQAADSKPPLSPRFETYTRPKTPVSTPMTMYDLKICNPMEKPKVTPYKAPMKDIIRLPPGTVAITPKKPVLVLAPVPSKDASVPSKDASVPHKETSVPPQITNTTQKPPIEKKSPSITIKGSPPALKSPPVSSNATVPVAKAALKNSVSNSSSSSESGSEAAPTPEKVAPPRKFVYQPPPKHFNRPFINETSNVSRPKETVVQKPEQKPKLTSIQSLSQMYTPASYKGSSSPAPVTSAPKRDQHQSSSSSEGETSFESTQKKPENKSVDEVVSPVNALIKSLHKQKSNPVFPAKPEVLKPKPQASFWVQKMRPFSQATVVSSVQPNDVKADKKVVSNATDRDRLGRKVSTSSSESSDEADGIPHDEKSSSFIVPSAAHVPPPKKRTFTNKPVTPPNTPDKPQHLKKSEKLSVADSLKSWVTEVNKNDSSSSEDSSDEDVRTAEETTGSYEFVSGTSIASVLPTSNSKDAKKQNALPNVVLIKHKPIVDKNTAVSYSKKKENDSPVENSAVFKNQFKTESLPGTVSVRKAVKTVERRLSSSSDDGAQKNQSKPPVPVQNNRRQHPALQRNTTDQNSKPAVTITPTEKKTSNRQDSVNRKSGSSEHSSSSETSAGEPFKEIDPYAIGRMIVRGSRKSDSVVKKPENLTNIRNASVPTHSPFSPIKSPTRKTESVKTTAPKPKLQKDNSSNNDRKPPVKPAVRSANSSSDEQGSYRVTKTKRGNFIRQSLSASSDSDSSDGEKGRLELSIEHDSDHNDGVYSANVAFIE